MKKLVLAGLALMCCAMLPFAAVAATAPALSVDMQIALPDPVNLSEVPAIGNDLEAAMLSAHIEGATRVIGKSQGYNGLAVLDAAVSCAVNGPDTPAMQTAWHPTPDELAALNAGAAVVVQLLGRDHPPILVGVAAPPVAT